MLGTRPTSEYLQLQPGLQKHVSSCPGSAVSAGRLHTGKGQEARDPHGDMEEDIRKRFREKKKTLSSQMLAKGSRRIWM